MRGAGPGDDRDGPAARWEPGAPHLLLRLALALMLAGGLAGARARAHQEAQRAERSTNLSHITGASRMMQIHVKNWLLQILPDGAVNGSISPTSDYTIFQRTSVSTGQVRMRAIATCLYLCMDSCGFLYSSKDYTEDCVFNETIELDNYNTYSSARWSTTRRTLYLALNRYGNPRRVQARGHNLGHLSEFTRAITIPADLDILESLQKRLLASRHNVRHHHHHQQQTLCPKAHLRDPDSRDRFHCRKRKKRKKKRRQCREGEASGAHCESSEGSTSGQPESKRSCEAAASEEACRREALDTPSKKRKSRIEQTPRKGKKSANNEKKSQRGKKKPLKRTSPQGKATPRADLSSSATLPLPSPYSPTTTSGDLVPPSTTAMTTEAMVDSVDASLEAFSEDSVYFDEDAQTSSSEFLVTMDTVSSEVTEENVYTSVPTVLRFEDGAVNASAGGNRTGLLAM